MGRAAFFVRTYSCPVRCPYCDSAGTWHKNFVPQHIQKMEPWDILEQINQGPRPEFVVVTGGEPCVHNLNPLTQLLHDNDIRVHLETSGAFAIQGQFEWITLSPKKWKMPILTAIHRAREFKFIIEEPADIDFYFKALDVEYRDRQAPIWLHPEWSHREDPVVLGAISDAVKNGLGRFRAGWQIHKPYSVDYRDSRTKEMVPLGGDLTKGY